MDLERFKTFDRYRALMEDYDAFIEALATPQPKCAWANPLRIDADALQARFEAKGMSFRRSTWRPDAFIFPHDAPLGATLDYIQGFYHIQEEIALAAVVALDPRPGEKLVDLCAAPGNKTALAALTMENRGTVIANDFKVGRLSALRFNLERLGVLNTAVTHYNAMGFPTEAGPFDKVIADVPCSCEGTARRSKGATRGIPDKVRLKLQRTQGHILRRALALARPGGALVYATCTFAPEENEGVLTDILDAMEGRAEIVPFEIPGLIGRPGVLKWLDREHRPDVVHARRYLPQDNDTGGFFVARIEVSP